MGAELRCQAQPQPLLSQEVLKGASFCLPCLPMLALAAGFGLLQLTLQPGAGGLGTASLHFADEALPRELHWQGHDHTTRQ